MLTPGLARSAAVDYGRAPGPSFLRGAKTCPGIITLLVKHNRAQLAKPFVVSGVRIQGDHAFAILSSKGSAVRDITLMNIGGNWRMVGLIANHDIDDATIIALVRAGNSGLILKAQSRGGTTRQTLTTTTAVRAARPVPDKSLTRVGHAANKADMHEIAALVKRYYAAAGVLDGAKACGLLTVAMEKSIPEDYGQPPGPAFLRGKTCPVVMTKLFKHPPDNLTTADLATTRTIGARVNGNHGVALLRSKGMPLGEMAVKREHGEWRVNVTIGSVN